MPAFLLAVLLSAPPGMAWADDDGRRFPSFRKTFSSRTADAERGEDDSNAVKAAGSTGKAAGSTGKAAGSTDKAAGSTDKAAGSTGKASGAKTVRVDGGVSFFFDDVDVYEVVQTVFGEVLKVNYVIDPGVKGRVNFRTVTPVPLDNVLTVMKVILRISGVGFVEEGGLYRIIPAQKVPGELIYTQIGSGPESVAIELFTFKNVNISDSFAQLEKIVDISLNPGELRAFPIESLNALVVVTPDKEKMESVRGWVKKIDVMFASARTKISVYPLQNSDAVHIANLLQGIFLGASVTPSSRSITSQGTSGSTGIAAGRTATSVSKAGRAATRGVSRAGSVGTAAGGGGRGGNNLVSSNTRIFADENTNSLIVLSTPFDFEIIEETIRKLDRVPRQVLIEVLVAEVTLTDELRFGIEWLIKSKVDNLSGEVSFDSGNIAQNLAGLSFMALDSGDVVRGILQTLASESKLKVLASPHILASDNRAAKIQVGDQVPVETSRSESTGGGTVLTSVQYRDTGVVLNVKPMINEGGLVSLAVSQEVSQISSTGVGGNPIISSRKAETFVVVQDGQTVVMGGLIQEETERVREGIPILRDIPILGYLFGYTRDKIKRTELIVLITPHVIRNTAEAGKVSRDFIRKLKVPPPDGAGAEGAEGAEDGPTNGGDR